VIEIKLDRLIDEMRLLRSQMIAFDRHLKPLAKIRPGNPAPAMGPGRVGQLAIAVPKAKAC
jgi:hypothetical protein